MPHTFSHSFFAQKPSVTYKQLQNKAPKSGPDPTVFQFSTSTSKIRINKHIAIPVNLHSPHFLPLCSLAWHSCLQHYLPFKYQLCSPLCGLPQVYNRENLSLSTPLWLLPKSISCLSLLLIHLPVYTPPTQHSPTASQSKLHVENRQSLAVLQASPQSSPAPDVLCQSPHFLAKPIIIITR